MGLFQRAHRFGALRTIARPKDRHPLDSELIRHPPPPQLFPPLTNCAGVGLQLLHWQSAMAARNDAFGAVPNTWCDQLLIG